MRVWEKWDLRSMYQEGIEGAWEGWRGLGMRFVGGWEVMQGFERQVGIGGVSE